MSSDDRDGDDLEPVTQRERWPCLGCAKLVRPVNTGEGPKCPNCGESFRSP